jgi:radical SAM superfamily enzyme YgiQ (UPF0313 family)
MSPFRALLVSTYDLGRQPFGLASPAARLEREGVDVALNDLAVEHLDEAAARRAALIAIHVPMQTATRLAARLLPRLRALNPTAHLACYGLYAPMNSAHLRALGAQTILVGEFEEGLASLASALACGESAPQLAEISLERQRFEIPARGALPPLDRYAHLHVADTRERVVGYTEATRGCKHLCRHCPVVPVYGGRFRAIDRDVVLEDIRRQVAMGAQHITFGDPDFWNAPGHAIPLVRALHDEFPSLTYDVTIKVEHLLQHASHVATLRDTGCLFVTTAVESIDDEVLAHLAKGHTAADFERVVALFRESNLHLAPTFVTFTPWTTLEGYAELLERIEALDLVESVAPIQLAIRLLIPAGSRLLELEAVRAITGEFDLDALSWRWRHPDERVDALHAAALECVRAGEKRHRSRRAIFEELRALAYAHLHPDGPLREAELSLEPAGLAPPRAPVPYLTEPWFC